MDMTDTQMVLLRHAAADPDGRVDIELPAGAAGRRAEAALRELAEAGYVEVTRGPESSPAGLRRLRITPEGRRALGGDLPEG